MPGWCSHSVRRWPVAEATPGSRRVELVGSSTPDNIEAGRTGLGLMIGLYIGRHSLMGAATGSERFEVAVAHFVGVVLVSVAGVLTLGVLYDRAKRTTEVVNQEAIDAAIELEAATAELPIGSAS